MNETLDGQQSREQRRTHLFSDSQSVRLFLFYLCTRVSQFTFERRNPGGFLSQESVRGLRIGL